MLVFEPLRPLAQPLRTQSLAMPSARTTRTLRQRLASALGSIAGVTTLVCLVLIVMLLRLNASVDQIRSDAELSSEGLVLALAVREQYMHEAHSLIERTSSHLGHHAATVRRVQAQATALKRRLPASSRQRVERIEAMSQRMNVVFLHDAMPAMEADDMDAMRTAHATLLDVSMRVIEETDALVEGLRARMRETEQGTQRASLAAVLVGACGVLLVLGLAILHSLELRRAILGPLTTLERAARRLGAGEAMEPLGELGTGELQTVARAFDQMAEQLRERERQLLDRERLAAIGELATGVAHEINNPIGVILGYLKTMIPEAESVELREELKILEQEARDCQRIVEDLKTFARAPTLAPSEVDMAALLEDAAARFRASDMSEDHAVEVEAAAEFLRVDAVRMRQVLSNLLSNAAQASANGDPIEVKGVPTASGYRVMIRDHGQGVPLDERELVFEPFHSKRPGGTGLGLAVCRGIVLAHGGTISIEDVQGGGAVFQIDLPSTPDPLEHEEVAA